MKKGLLYLFMLIATVFITTSCHDDDDIYMVTDSDINGVYLGTMDVKAPFGEAGDLGATGIKQKIYIKRTGENLAQLQLKNFEFNGIKIGDLEINDVAVEKINEEFQMIGSGKLTLIVGGCDVKVSGKINTSGSCNLIINVDVTSQGAGGLNFIGLKVTVDFTGNRLTADQSSEAIITAFNFNSDSVTNVIINKNTIEFYTIDGIVNMTFTPTITISEGATISPASGVTQDFAVPVTYTVTSQDGITVTTYTVKRQGKIKYFDFEEWETESTYGYEKLTAGSFASTNEGSGLVYSIIGQLPTIPGFEDVTVPAWCVRSTNEGKAGKAAILETIDLTQAKADLQRYGESLPESDRGFVDYILGMCPNITAGSLFSGTFDLGAAMGNPLSATLFGIPYTGSKPLTFSGWYKYTPGAEFHDETNQVVSGKTDECSIYAVLYEAKASDDSEITLDGTNINTSEAVILKAELADKTAKADWTHFEIAFEPVNNKEYTPEKEYKLAIVCTSSKEGDRYKGAPGSTLVIDSFEIVTE